MSLFVRSTRPAIRSALRTSRLTPAVQAFHTSRPLRVSSGSRRSASPVSPHGVTTPETFDPSMVSLGSNVTVPKGTTMLKRAEDDEVHDLVGVGFGPASMAIGIALHDALQTGQNGNKYPRVRFLERQREFAWHAGMMIPRARMQVTFLKDLATMRNPQSEFTFLNYLHTKKRLVPFANIGTFLPQRAEYEDYMRWCASHFSEIVDYGQTVQTVDAGKYNAKGEVEYFNITSVDRDTGEKQTVKAKHVVIAAGGRPNIPKSLPQNHPRIIHSSQYHTNISQMFPAGSAPPKRVAVVGAGQSAAEIWHDITNRFPGAQSNLLIRGGTLKSSDDSPFVNEIFNPEAVDDIFIQDPVLRAEALANNKGTNYGVIRRELLERIYDDMYSYQMRYASEEQWPHRLMKHRTVTGMRDATRDGTPTVELQVQNNTGSHTSKTVTASQETLEADLVVVATGYIRDSHEEMLASLKDFMPGGEIVPGMEVLPTGWRVARNYAVEFAKGTVQSDAGIWLQGCNEKTHGLSDTLLSIIAVRGGQMVESIFGYTPNGTVKTL